MVGQEDHIASRKCTPLTEAISQSADSAKRPHTSLPMYRPPTAVPPLDGKLRDIHGRRPGLLASIGILAAGSAACGAAPGVLSLILGRARQGVGGGGILPVAQAIMADAIAPRERGRYQAY